MKILTFDQATTTGFSVFENGELIEFGHQKFKTKDAQRYNETKRFVADKIKAIQPQLVVIEDIQMQMSASTFKGLAQLQAVLVDYFIDNEILYQVVPPVTWKSYCDIKGRKREEQKKNTVLWVKNRFDVNPTEDEADAIAIGYYATKKIKVENA